VKILKDGFAIVTKDGMIKAKRLRSDATGLFVLEKDLCVEKGRWDIYYRCDTCHLVFQGSDEARKHMREYGHKRFHMI